MNSLVRTWTRCLIFALLVSFLPPLATSSNARSDLRVGSKDFTEQKILSEMVAALAEDGGLSVQRFIPYGDTRTTMEGLKRGDIDIYVAYDGTGLIMLGLPAVTNSDEAIKEVRHAYGPLNLVWGKRLGFNNTYTVIMQPEYARRLGIDKISELSGSDRDMVLGVESNFAKRSVDGYTAFINRYGLKFKDVKIVAIDDRKKLYDMLLSGEVDAIEGYTTDGQIFDYHLLALQDDLNFFPSYNGAPLYRKDIVEKFPDFITKLDGLSGKITDEVIRKMNVKVELEGASPRQVAVEKLVELNLIDGSKVKKTEEKPIQVAISPFYMKSKHARTTLRAVRLSYPKRAVNLLPTSDALGAVGSETARMALVSADAFFNLTDDGKPQRDDRFEGVAAVGTDFVHVVAGTATTELSQCSRFVTGDANGSSAKVANIIKSTYGLDIDVAATADTDITELVNMAKGSDCVLLLSPLPNAAIENALANNSEMHLLPITNWADTTGPAMYTFLRQAQLNNDVYSDQGTIETLSEQVLLAGFAPDLKDVVGQQGPGSISSTPQPLSARVIASLNKSIGSGVDIDPTLRRAASLIKTEPLSKANNVGGPISTSIVSFLVLCFLIWAGWLAVKPDNT